ncbi:MAG: hypothetical protein ACPGVU_00570 [Limisphaerales bacterium]
MRFLLLYFATASLAWAQLPISDLQTITPRAAKAGTTIEITIAGVNVESATSLRFTDRRIKVTPKRNAVEELVPNPAAVPYRFNVEIPTNVPPGIYEVRALGHLGLSTARPFVVAAPDSEELDVGRNHTSREQAIELPLGTFVNARLNTRTAHWYRFNGRKGQRLLVRFWGERIDAQIDGQLAIHDSTGRELARKKFSQNRDPLADFTPPADGQYFLRVADLLYRGGSKQFYRVQISETPHIDFIFPPAGEPGKTSKFTVYGRNLPGGRPSKLSIDGRPLEEVDVEVALPYEPQSPVVFSGARPRQAAYRGFDYQLAGSALYRIGYATAPVVKEKPNATNQVVTIPAEIAGRFDRTRDHDTFQFRAEKGKTYWLDVISDQLRAPTDSVLIVEKLNEGKVPTKVAENDDRPSYFSRDNLDATDLDTTDSLLSFTADANADYRVSIFNRFAAGGSEHLYRLAIREATPDFDLFSLYERPLANGRAGWPASPILRRGGTIALRIVAPRQDGFDGEITVTASGLPKGVTVHPLKMSDQVDQGVLIFTAATNAANWAGPIKITGTAKIGDVKISRLARSTSLVWGVVFADAFRVRSKLDLETVLSVCAEDTTPVTLQPKDGKTQWTVELGNSLKIPVQAANLVKRTGNLTIQPEGLFGLHRSPPTVNLAADATEGTLTIRFTKTGNFDIEPGTYQFSLQGTGVAPYSYHPQAATVARAEQKRIRDLQSELAEELSKVKAAEAQAKKTLDEITRNEASATGSDKAPLTQRLAKAKQTHTEAKAAVTSLEAKVKRADQLKSAINKVVSAAAAKAKSKSEKFAVYSPPLTVKVLPKPAKK